MPQKQSEKNIRVWTKECNFLLSDNEWSVFSRSKLYRLDGPAVKFGDGSEEWWNNGKLHRTNGPAIVSVNGTMEWWINGECHREDGPAVIRENGIQQWYFNGNEILNEWFEENNIDTNNLTKEDKILIRLRWC